MLVADNITKKFPGVTALDNVCMELHGGKVTAIIGENGAGKSTLMKILSGVYKEYGGRIIYKGNTARFSNPKEAQDKGIAIIHQELNLVPYLSITENIFLGRELTTWWGTLDASAMRRKTEQLLQRLKLNIDPATRVSELKVGQQQVVEIAKALLADSDVIIMDEPTSAISESEVDILFRIIEDLRNDNKAIVYISHKLDELFRIADSYIVLRDGKTIESGSMKTITRDQLIHKMVGRDIQVLRRPAPEAAREELLRISNNRIAFALGKGEIIGIFGLMGAGRTELLEEIFGMQNGAETCMIYVEKKRVKLCNPSQAIKAGLALVPEDRKKDGLIAGLDVRSNISITTLAGLETAGILSSSKETALALHYISELKIKTSSEKQLAGNLSGGNQQKIVLAKWLATKPKILMLDEPTRGIDINAKNEIYKIILKLADAGIGIIMVSSELPEILAVTDRVLVMAEGAMTADIPVKDATEDRILKAAIPKTI